MAKKLFKNPFTWIILLSLFSQAYFFNRGFLTHDEGNILHAAQRIVGGDTIYKNFMYPYTPGVVFATALSFKLFGESILSGRVLMVIVSTFSALLIFEIVRISSKKTYLAFMASLVYLSWGPTHINFPWPTVFAIFSGVLVIFFLLQAYNKKSGLLFFLTGAAAFATFLFKQNFGVAILATLFITYLFNRKVTKKVNVLNFILGYASAVLTFEVYLVATNSLFAFINNFYQITIKEIFVNNSLTTPFIYEYSVRGLLKALVYLIPAVVSIFYIFLVAKERETSKIFLSVGVFVLLFYILGIRPTTDYTRLSVLMSLVGLPLALSVQLTQKPKFKLLLNLFTLFLIISGFYSALFVGYYRWETPLVKQNKYLYYPRAKIFTDEKYSKVISEISPIVEKYTKYTDRGDYIFAYKHAPMFYFLFDRKNPTRYLSIARGSFRNVDPKEIIYDLEEKNVKLVILQGFDITNEDPIIKYINTNYQQVLKTPDYNVLVTPEF